MDIYAILDPTFTIPLLVAIAAFATIVTLAMPLLGQDRLRSRMRQVATERERLRAQQREELERARNQSRLRQTPQSFMLQLVNQFNLRKLLEGEQTRDRLRMAGLRGEGPLITFLFFRFVTPFLAGLFAFLYLYTFDENVITPLIRLLITIGAAYLGFYVPNIVVSNIIQRRQQSIQRYWPDALDLMLICVEAGMSIEAAIQRVAREIGGQSVPLAEELSLTHAELSYLQDRRRALENLSKRTGLPQIKAVVTSLIQAERYGTPVGQALRVLAQENRDMRMSEAEKKAAALPPKLTVPMILFFLPVIFVVILGPAAIKLMETF